MKIAELEEIIEDLEKKKDEIYILNIFILYLLYTK